MPLNKETKPLFVIRIYLAQLGVIVDCIDNISAERKEYPSLTSVLDMTLSNLMVRLQIWSFEEYGVSFYYDCFQV